MGQLYKNVIKLMAEDNQVLFIGTVNLLPFDEKLIIEKSIKFFDDSEPCFLHRSAVKNRLYTELDEFVNKKKNAQRVSVQEMPPEILEILTGIEDVKSLEAMDIM